MMVNFWSKKGKKEKKKSSWKLCFNGTGVLFLSRPDY